MPEWFQIASAALAFLGAVLGVLSTWSGLTRDRARLKIRPVWICKRRVGTRQVTINTRRRGALVEFPDGELGVEIINLGYVAVRISEFGVCPGRFFWFHWLREFAEPNGRRPIREDAAGNVVLPHELAPGASVRLTFPAEVVKSPKMAGMRSVYVLTQREQLFVGRSALLHDVAKAAGKAIGRGVA